MQMSFPRMEEMNTGQNPFKSFSLFKKKMDPSEVDVVYDLNTHRYDPCRAMQQHKEDLSFIALQLSTLSLHMTAIHPYVSVITFVRDGVREVHAYLMAIEAPRENRFAPKAYSSDTLAYHLLYLAQEKTKKLLLRERKKATCTKSMA